MLFKSTIFFALVTIVGPLALSAEATISPILWRLTRQRPNTTEQVYILGTNHVGGLATEYPRAVTDLLVKARAAYFELDLQDRVYSEQQKGTVRVGQLLSAAMTKTYLKIMNAKNTGLEEKYFLEMSPLKAQTLIELPGQVLRALYGKGLLDNQLQEMALNAGVAVKGLDNIARSDFSTVDGNSSIGPLYELLDLLSRKKWPTLDSI